MFLSPGSCDVDLHLMRSWDSACLTSKDWQYIINDYLLKHSRRILNPFTNKYELSMDYPFYEYLSDLLNIYHQNRIDSVKVE